MVKILYFSWIAQQLDQGEENIALPDGVVHIHQLVGWLRKKSPAHDLALADCDMIKVAINQNYTDFDAVVQSGDEIAFFPPVTGG